MTNEPSLAAKSLASYELVALIKIVAAFRSKSAEFPMQWAAVLTAVAYRPGVSASELRTRLSMSPAALSRTVHALSAVHPSGAAGLNLLKAVTDPQDTRKQRLYLSERGLSFLHDLSGYVREVPGRTQGRPSRLRGVLTSPLSEAPRPASGPGSPPAEGT